MSDMSDQAPIYLTKLESLRRGIEQGWYVVDTDGNPCIGPFPTREACIDQPGHAEMNASFTGVRLRAAQAKWDRLSASDYEEIRSIPELIAKVAERYSLPHEQAKRDVETWDTEMPL
jgi:hypothetical protein